MQEGQNAMIKRETTDTIPLLHVVQQSSTIDPLPFKSKHLFNGRCCNCVYTRFCLSFCPCTLILRRANLAPVYYQAEPRGVPRVKTVRQ